MWKHKLSKNNYTNADIKAFHISLLVMMKSISFPKSQKGSIRFPESTMKLVIAFLSKSAL